MVHAVISAQAQRTPCIYGGGGSAERGKNAVSTVGASLCIELVCYDRAVVNENMAPTYCCMCSNLRGKEIDDGSFRISLH
jgi:hypothetical protein